MSRSSGSNRVRPTRASTSRGEPGMHAPDVVRFTDRLAEAQRAALARGEMSRRDYDALLMDPEFEDEAFERFRARLVAAGVRLPEDEVEDAGARLDTRQLAGEPERDLLDL